MRKTCWAWLMIVLCPIRGSAHQFWPRKTTSASRAPDHHHLRWEKNPAWKRGAAFFRFIRLNLSPLVKALVVGLVLLVSELCSSFWLPISIRTRGGIFVQSSSLRIRAPAAARKVKDLLTFTVTALYWNSFYFCGVRNPIHLPVMEQREKKGKST